MQYETKREHTTNQRTMQMCLSVNDLVTVATRKGWESAETAFCSRVQHYTTGRPLFHHNWQHNNVN